MLRCTWSAAKDKTQGISPQSLSMYQRMSCNCQRRLNKSYTQSCKQRKSRLRHSSQLFQSDMTADMFRCKGRVFRRRLLGDSWDKMMTIYIRDMAVCMAGKKQAGNLCQRTIEMGSFLRMCCCRLSLCNSDTRIHWTNCMHCSWSLNCCSTCKAANRLHMNTYQYFHWSHPGTPDNTFCQLPRTAWAKEATCSTKGILMCLWCKFCMEIGMQVCMKLSSCLRPLTGLINQRYSALCTTELCFMFVAWLCSIALSWLISGLMLTKKKKQFESCYFRRPYTPYQSIPRSCMIHLLNWTHLHQSPQPYCRIHSQLCIQTLRSYFPWVVFWKIHNCQSRLKKAENFGNFVPLSSKSTSDRSM